MRDNIHTCCILVIDFGSQYTELIVRIVRKLGVYCERYAWNVTEEQIRALHPNGIILSGGPESTTEQNSPRAPDYVFQAGVPVIGICYGMQIMAIQLGGKVKRFTHREFGYAQVKVVTDSLFIRNIYDDISSEGIYLLNVWMSHKDKVTVIPVDFITLASTDTCPFAIIANEKKHFYGVQFHPEVTHTHQGYRILKRFVLDICQCIPIWTSINIIEDIIVCIRKKINNDRVILGLSGGIDSAVTAILLHLAINSRLTCVFINNGLLCLNEANEVIQLLTNHYHLNIIHIEAEDRFLSALVGIKHPEHKRKIIGQVFIEVFNEQARKLNNIKWLAQGTICSDIIESVVSITNKIHTIKSHHNVGGLPKSMKMSLIEPLKALFKDEVRKIGLELGLPYNILYRYPFPGPGLGVRVLGEVKKEYCDILRSADAIFIEELHKVDLYNKVSQAFTVFLPIRSVGVMGDKRKYDWVISLRAVQTIDFMTAKWVHLPYELLERVSTRIINEINHISRVVYDISSKPPSTIEWE